MAIMSIYLELHFLKVISLIGLPVIFEIEIIMRYFNVKFD